MICVFRNLEAHRVHVFTLFRSEDLDGVTLMGFTVFKEIMLRDYYLSRRGLEKFSNAFDVLECKHNLRLPCKEGPRFCYSEPWPLIVLLGTKGKKVTFY